MEPREIAPKEQVYLEISSHKILINRFLFLVSTGELAFAGIPFSHSMLIRQLVCETAPMLILWGFFPSSFHSGHLGSSNGHWSFDTCNRPPMSQEVFLIVAVIKCF